MTNLSYSRILDVSRREKGLVPQQEVDESHSHDLVAEAQLSAAQSHVIACEQRIRVAQADQARLKTLFQYGVITAREFRRSPARSATMPRGHCPTRKS